jgi:hypothetical protein
MKNTFNNAEGVEQNNSPRRNHELRRFFAQERKINKSALCLTTLSALLENALLLSESSVNYCNLNSTRVSNPRRVVTN